MEITSYLSECIKTQTPVAFLKYGDDEYLAAVGTSGCNCDKDNYTEILKDGLIKSFTYMIDNGPNTFVGMRDDDGSHIEFWNKFVEKPVQVAKYHSVILYNDQINEKIHLLKTIKESSLKKMYICNPIMNRAEILLNIDYMFHIPFNNWVDKEFDIILDAIKSIINPEEQHIILTSAGMGSKLLISELTKLFPKNIYIDIGSGLDKICTKKTSRGWEPSYEELMNLLSDIIPSGWESPQYEGICKYAEIVIGSHL